MDATKLKLEGNMYLDDSDWELFEADPAKSGPYFAVHQVVFGELTIFVDQIEILKNPKTNQLKVVYGGVERILSSSINLESEDAENQILYNLQIILELFGIQDAMSIWNIDRLQIILKDILTKSNSEILELRSGGQLTNLLKNILPNLTNDEPSALHRSIALQFHSLLEFYRLLSTYLTVIQLQTRDLSKPTPKIILILEALLHSQGNMAGLINLRTTLINRKISNAPLDASSIVGSEHPNLVISFFQLLIVTALFYRIVNKNKVLKHEFDTMFWIQLSRNLDTKFNFSEVDIPKIFVDTEHFGIMALIIEELSRNAVKYSPVGADIKVSFKNQDGEFKLTIQNSLEHAPRDDIVSTRNGLMLVHSLAEWLGGELVIIVDREDKMYSSTITIPYANLVLGIEG